MSKSYKKHAVTGWTGCRSEKRDKQLANRRYRLAVKDFIRRGEYHLIPEVREVSNVFSFGKDGKQRLDSAAVVRK